jgi:hypothetical protein
MNIEVLSLCDAATVDVDGKLNVLGAFDTFWTGNVPALYPACAIAIRIRFDNSERGVHTISINFVDLDGNFIIPAINGKINVSFPDEQRSGSANLVFNIQRLRLENHGEYSIDLSVDGTMESTAPLFVRERKSEINPPA